MYSTSRIICRLYTENIHLSIQTRLAHREEVVNYTSKRKATASSMAFVRAEMWSKHSRKVLQKGVGNILDVSL